MRSTSSPEPVLVDPLDLDAIAAAFCRRFGEATAEAYRLTSLHEVLDHSRALARALDDFTHRASAHYRGVHCTEGVQVEVDRLRRVLAAWAETVFAAGGTYRAWTEEGALPPQPRLETVALPDSGLGGAEVVAGAIPA